MSEKQAFGVLVRGVGALVFLEGLRALWFAFAQWAMRAFGGVTFAMAAPGLIYGLVALTLGTTLIRWPQWLVHLAWLEKLPTIGCLE